MLQALAMVAGAHLDFFGTFLVDILTWDDATSQTVTLADGNSIAIDF